VALEFLYRDAIKPDRVAIFPGAWNPPTIAHAGIALAALNWARRNGRGELVWILPAALPHKAYDGIAFSDRRRMIELLARSHPGFSAAISEGGLYSEIAEEARAFFGPATEIGLACGRDAADRIATWDYGASADDVFGQLVMKHPLLVAARAGEYEPPDRHRDCIVSLPLPNLDDVSSTEVRRRIAAQAPWQHLVPPAIADVVAQLYSKK
jgi:nicotinate-nucleotide adenylyltransferase